MKAGYRPPAREGFRDGGTGRRDPTHPISSPARSSIWERLEALYGAALDLAPEERAEFLSRECAGDPTMRADVESLLSRGGDALALFDRLEPLLRKPPEDLGVGAAAGERIGPYEIVREIGRGGMGVVYEASDARLGRTVALKFLPPWLSGDRRAKEGLIAEAKAASATDHPNIATLYEIEETAEGALCLVIAHYQGETLKERLAREPMATDEAIEVARQVAAGLAAAHGRGIVHRDIKPANLFLTAGGLVKILDFGVAKVLGSDRTQTAAGHGTPAYMSPEQALGEQVDARSDLWSLGVVLYEMVTGRQPFQSEREAGVVRAILEDEPCSVEPFAGSELDRVVRKLMARDPGDRYQTAEDLAADLARYLAAEPVLASGRSSGRHYRRWIVPAAAAGFVSAGAILIGGRDSPSTVPPTGIARVAVLPFEVHGNSQYEYLEEGIVDLLSVSLDGAGDLRSVDPRAILSSLDPEAESQGIDPREGGIVADHFGAQAYVLGDIVEVQGRLRIRASLYDLSGGPTPEIHVAMAEGSVEQLFHLVDELTTQLLTAMSRDSGDRKLGIAAATTRSLPAIKSYLGAEAALRRGRFRIAVEGFHRAIAHDSLFALAYYELSRAAAWNRQPELVIEAAARARELGARLPERERQLVLAYAAYVNGDIPTSERLYRAVLASYPSSVDAWQGLGELLFHYNSFRGRSKFEARQYFERALHLDPHFGEAIFHLLEIAVWDGERQRFERLFVRLQGEQPVWGALKAFTWGTDQERSAAMNALRVADEHDIVRAWEALEFTDDLEAASRVARVLDGPSLTTEWRVVGLHALVETEMGRGRYRSSLAYNDSVAVVDPAWALLSRALLVTSPMMPVRRGEIIRIRQDLEAWDPDAAPPSTNTFFGVHDPHRPQIRLYLLGLLDVRLGDLDTALDRAAALHEMERLAVDSATSITPGSPAEVTRALGAAVRARVLRAQGDRGGALALLEGARIRPRDEQVWSPFFAQPGELWLRAEILRELGRPEEAVVWYRSLDELMPGFRTRPPAVLRIAQIQDHLGQHEAAARSYRRVLEFWDAADPELQPLVETASRRLAALARNSPR